MESLGEIFNKIFNNPMSANISAVIAWIGMMVMAGFKNMAVKKITKADKQETELTKQIKKQDKEIETLKDSNALLANILVTIALASNNLDTNIKKEIATLGNKFKDVAKIDLTSLSSDLIDAIVKHVPGTSLNEKKVALLDEIKKHEDAMDTVINNATDALDIMTGIQDDTTKEIPEDSTAIDNISL